MKIVECLLENQSKLMEQYNESNDQFVQSFFDYSYQNNPYTQRYNELSKLHFQRGCLFEHLLKFNKKYNCSNETVHNAKKLLDPKSVVVVGGQQAGVLTGPLYTIHKIITIIKLAKQQEEKLSVPVVPIFWIAGEDHDFEEINHIFSIRRDSKLHKRKVDQQNNAKKSVSDLHLEQNEVLSFVKEVFLDGIETSVTNTLLSELNKIIAKSKNYVDFFSFLVHRLFKNSGIVLLDSHNPELRKLEIPYLKQMILNNEQINDKFLQSANALYNQGYGEPIERGENSAHLFYHHKGSRLLLERIDANMFSDKKGICQFSKEDLLQLVEKQPENFSNNVVTRPLMQELLLPVLAFVGGPGEIAYWATLKEVFHLFGLKMPPVVPRLSMTIVSPQVNKLLEEFNISAIDAITNGSSKRRNELTLWDEKDQINETLHEVLDEVEDLHQPLKDLVNRYDKGLEALALKNELIIKRELTFLARKIEKSLQQKYEQQLLKFALIDANLFPNNGFQERSLNILRYLNEHGLDFVERMTELKLELNDKHKLIYLK
ncbi:bacillithiol biosynthesis cysteine-adding enzyme BshC [Anaerobacillus alkalilacustris]|uniref:Putative cysteine ligase BshC n=1 Tax=Anaerobacillus alkalilacustris TaxID=393763 RepID=A0A1S2LPC0_9BACI|nr:bacillithiol biosynthesis cysteine-adding enzyme BshC [Anaerobacillus alkalilacustris]OIJ13265.1 bacillithiol biosynthesis cysteine-adding enzyme BshC [Anaerobacillus alkalilacustris]